MEYMSGYKRIFCLGKFTPLPSKLKTIDIRKKGEENEGISVLKDILGILERDIYILKFFLQMEDAKRFLVDGYIGMFGFCF